MKHYSAQLLVVIILCAFSPAFAGDINARLDTTDGSTAFSVKDSNNSEVAHIASDGDAYFQGNIGVGTSDTSSGKLVVNGNIAASPPTADNHVATKAYVDAASGGTGLVWRGYAPGSDGNMGGFMGMNGKCHAAFPGSHTCTYDEIIRLGNNYPNTDYAWLIDGEYIIGSGENRVRYTIDGSEEQVVVNDANQQYRKFPLCRGWAENDSRYLGPHLHTSGFVGWSPCNNTIIKIPCCD